MGSYAQIRSAPTSAAERKSRFQEEEDFQRKANSVFSLTTPTKSSKTPMSALGFTFGGSSAAPATPAAFEQRAAVLRQEDSEDEKAEADLTRLEEELMARSPALFSRSVANNTAAVGGFGFVGSAIRRSLGDGDEGGEAGAGTGAGAGDSPPVRADLSGEFQKLLGEVRNEPTDDDELSAKFALFENFLATVSNVRTTTLDFWSENKQVFPEGNMRNASEREVKALDGHDSMGIPDDDAVWFVYHMLRQANQNSEKISRLLASLKTRLELLSQDLGECPICLEEIPRDEVQLLSCAHKTCKSCWDHYLSLQRGRQAVCPLCRHEEFLEHIATPLG